jgi:hypothetical protein
MSYFESNWCSLNWTPWVSFSGSRSEWKLLPSETGVYRVRPLGTSIIAYIGETGRNLKSRLSSLRRGTMADLMPYNDPHTAAPNLWAWRQEEHWDYECSAAIFTKSKAERKALECFLLWKYRLEKGESTLCNHGRFHKNYVKSSNRSRNKRGFRLSEPELNPSRGPSHPPLELQGQPLDENWMGIRWSKTIPLSLNASSQVPDASAVYKISATWNNALMYIGETQRLHTRFIQHCRKFKDYRLLFSFSKQPASIADYQLHEIENDLIAAYYYQTSLVPNNQFSNETNKA